MFGPHTSLTESIRTNYWLYSLIGVLGALLTGYLIGTQGLVGAVVPIGLPLGLAGLVGVLVEPRLGLLLYVQLSFMLGLTRYVQVNFPAGLLIDALLTLTLLSTFLNGKRMAWHRLNHPAFYLVLGWFVYNVLELFNPEAPYRPAWFFHVRAFSMQWFMAGLIVLVVPITRQDIRWLIRSWLGWSVLAALWAFKQQYIGLTPGEVEWLNNGNAKTHVLFGQLRSFSFYSDAAQFGAEMASVTLVCVIRLFEEKAILRRLGFLALAGVYFWGYAVSGTRSALFVMLAGFAVYLLLKRDFLKLFIGFCLAVPLVLLLMYTSVGSGNYQVQRMRSALTPMNDPSFLLRLENQRKLAAYLDDLPFGAGIGTSADAGARFSPEHFAAQIPPDSWYVELWIETGRVGVGIYLFMLAGLLLIGTYNAWHLRDPWLVKVMFTFLSVFAGLAVMAYSNPVFGQFPTSTLVFIYSLLFATSYRWDTPAPAPASAVNHTPYDVLR